MKELLLVSFGLLLVSCASEETLYQNHMLVDDINVNSLSTELDDLLPSLMDDENIRGASLAILDDTDVILIRSYGVTNAQTRAVVTRTYLKIAVAR